MNTCYALPMRIDTKPIHTCFGEGRIRQAMLSAGVSAEHRPAMNQYCALAHVRLAEECGSPGELSSKKVHKD